MGKDQDLVTRLRDAQQTALMDAIQELRERTEDHAAGFGLQLQMVAQAITRVLESADRLEQLSAELPETAVQPRPYPQRRAPNGPAMAPSPPARPVVPTTSGLLKGAAAAGIMTPGQAAEYLGIKKATLGVYRRQKKGPAYSLDRNGGREPYRYAKADLDSWARDRGGKVGKRVAELNR